VVERLDLAFLIDREDDGARWWIDVEPTIARSLAANRGSLDSLNQRVQCGCKLCSRQVRYTELALMPRIAAMAADVQYVGRNLCSGRGNARPAGLVGQQVGNTIRHEALLPSPDGRFARAGATHDLGRAGTVCRQQHDLRRQTCFRGLFRFATVAFRSTRSVALTSTLMPLRIQQTRTPATQWES
jgi:hypothetical protein